MQQQNQGLLARKWPLYPMVPLSREEVTYGQGSGWSYRQSRPRIWLDVA